MFPVNTALMEAVARVGDKWTLLLVSALLDGPRRFNDLVDDLGGIAPNVLSQRLRQLEQHGILVATPYSTRPPRFVYQLTGSGLELAGVLRLLAQWGAGQGPSSLFTTRHGPAEYCTLIGAASDVALASTSMRRLEIET